MKFYTLTVVHWDVSPPSLPIKRQMDLVFVQDAFSRPKRALNNVRQYKGPLATPIDPQKNVHPTKRRTSLDYLKDSPKFS